MIDVMVYDGKYRYVFDNDGARAYRHGDPWRDCCGDGLILALAQDLEEARQHRDKMREALEAIQNCNSLDVIDEIVSDTISAVEDSQ